MLSSLCFCVYIKVVTFIYKRKISFEIFIKGWRKRRTSIWPSDAAGWPSGQTKAAEPPQGRADLRAPKRSAARPQAAAEAPKNYYSKEKGYFCGD